MPVQAAEPSRSEKPTEEAESEPSRSGRIDFNRDIRPLISNHCLACHGPDESERAAGLRLDTASGAKADLGGYAAVVPGDPEASEMYLRLTAEDEDIRMPPADHGPRLPDEQVELVRRWIAQGADYAEHWSYVVPRRPSLPEVARDDWANNAIDRFVLARLEAAGLEPSPPAEPLALARRAAIDLTGLPPNWEEAERFAEDPSPDAYERYIDRLLANPAFGERWARVWLDLARYADSAGYADDPPRTIWAYRDYVIRSLNANKPFDQFTIEQLAGDLLEKPSREQLVATAFHRNTLTNNEGGTNDEEFRNVAVVDRVNTTMSVWMGTTMACAQCHTHKYDPITQEEYFRFFAFFNSTEDSDKRDERPVLELWSEQQERIKRRLRGEIGQLAERLKTPTEQTRTEAAEWVGKLGEPPEWSVWTPESVSADQRGLRVDERGVVLADEARPDEDRYTLRFSVSSGRSPGAAGDDVSEDPSADGQASPVGALQIRVPAEQANNFVLSQVQLRWMPQGHQAGDEAGGNATSAPGETQSVEIDHADGAVPVAIAAAVADYEQPGFPADSVRRESADDRGGWAIGGEVGKPHRLTLVLEKPLSADPGTLEMELLFSSRHKRHVLDRFQVLATGHEQVSSWARLPERIRGIVSREPGSWSEEERDRVDRYFLKVSPRLAPVRAEHERLSQQLASMEPETTVPILRELPPEDRRTTRVQIRGNYQATAQEVSAGTPAVFPPLPEELPRNRLAVARWLVDDRNPLTPRVIANRHWEQLFGQGLVATSEEFGSQGEPPSHPQLLDWLAVELRESGWDLKHLIKQIVMSSTYRQRAVVTPEQLETDPANRLLARGPRFRISAEMVRDQALAVSGLLSRQLHGPPVKPPQPEMGLKAAFGSATDWSTSEGADRYRRGLYTTWRRSNPYPSMTAFDAPNREVCQLRRSRTNTPLQALVTLNDPVYVEAARTLAQHLIDGGETVQDRIRTGFRRVLIREPSSGELARLEELYRTSRERFESDRQLAEQLAGGPAHGPPVACDEAELAAWTLVSNVLLNLDEVFMKR